MIRISGERAFFHAIVGNLQPKRISFGGEADGNFGRSGMMERMENSFVGDAVSVQGRLGARSRHVPEAMKLTRKGMLESICKP